MHEPRFQSRELLNVSTYYSLVASQVLIVRYGGTTVILNHYSRPFFEKEALPVHLGCFSHDSSCVNAPVNTQVSPLSADPCSNPITVYTPPAYKSPLYQRTCCKREFIHCNSSKHLRVWNNGIAEGWSQAEATTVNRKAKFKVG